MQSTNNIHEAVPKRAKRRAVIGLVGVLALVIAGCGSSKKTSTPTTAAAASSATTPAGAGSSGLAAAQAFVDQHTAQPTQISITQPIGKPVPQGKSVYFIPCGPNPECQQEGKIVKQADDLLGWSTTIAPNDGTPQGSKAAFQLAINNHANAILYTAIDQSVFASYEPQLQAGGIFLSTCCVTYRAGTGSVGYAVDTPDQVGGVGGGQAALVAVNSQCKSADSVVVNLPDFAILKPGVDAYKAAMAKYCPSSSVSELDIALSNIATAPSTIVSYARAHPNVKYIVASTDGVTIGVPAALTAAGLSSSVKIVGQGATPTNIQYLHANQEVGDAAFPYYEVMWGMVDAVARHYAGAQVLPSVPPPLWLLTPQNAPASSGAAFPVVTNYAQQYKALWGVS